MNRFDEWLTTEPEPTYIVCSTCEEPIGTTPGCEECTEHRIEYCDNKPPF